MCGGRWPSGWRWIMRGSIRPRWCTGGSRIAKSERPHRINEAVRQDGGADRDAGGPAPPGGGLHDPGRRGGHPGHHHPAGLAIRRVGRQVPGAAEQIAAVCTGHDYSSPGKPTIDWDDPAAKDALVSALVNDANALVEAFEAREAGRAGGLGVGAAGPGRRAGRRARRGLRRHRWAVADRPQGRRGPGDLHRGPDARHTRKSARGPPRRVPGACGGRPARPGSSPMRS